MCFLHPVLPWYHPSMETVIRHVRDIETSERRVLERVVGHPLKEDQKVIIQVVTSGSQPAAEPRGTAPAPLPTLPDWCNVYEGLTEEQLADVERVVLQRADLTRPPR